ncbi:MAG TPA: DUF86 domain-containing protein [bacterium]|nr:DUF86 domain-containing protein [bacterium]HOL66160.1 DUF86 domain-containing protein [bacterium]HPP11917.1 DUF86 domain-containing protein [bacterium]
MAPSGIDKEKLFIQLERLREHMARIKEVKTCGTNERFVITALERNLQLAIEDCLNIGSHIISGLSLRRPETYREIFQSLKQSRVLSEPVAGKMMALASFRNRLVHLYRELTTDEVLEQLRT